MRILCPTIFFSQRSCGVEYPLLFSWLSDSARISPNRAVNWPSRSMIANAVERFSWPSGQDLTNGPPPHGPAAFADREPQTLLHGPRRDQLDRQSHVVARHHHLRATRQLRHSRHVRRAEVELRTIPLEERR